MYLCDVTRVGLQGLPNLNFKKEESKIRCWGTQNIQPNITYHFIVCYLATKATFPISYH